MPCNFKAELITAINSNRTLKAIHQKYIMASTRIILKMDSSKHKYSSNDYLNEYEALNKALIDDFTIAEKLLILVMEIDNLELAKILAECGNINYILVAIMDKKLLH